MKAVKNLFVFVILASHFLCSSAHDGDSQEQKELGKLFVDEENSAVNTKEGFVHKILAYLGKKFLAKKVKCSKAKEVEECEKAKEKLEQIASEQNKNGQNDQRKKISLVGDILQKALQIDTQSLVSDSMDTVTDVNTANEGEQKKKIAQILNGKHKLLSKRALFHKMLHNKEKSKQIAIKVAIIVLAIFRIETNLVGAKAANHNDEQQDQVHVNGQGKSAVMQMRGRRRRRAHKWINMVFVPANVADAKLFAKIDHWSRHSKLFARTLQWPARLASVLLVFLLALSGFVLLLAGWGIGLTLMLYILVNAIFATFLNIVNAIFAQFFYISSDVLGEQYMRVVAIEYVEEVIKFFCARP